MQNSCVELSTRVNPLELNLHTTRYFAKCVKDNESHATYVCTRFYRAPCLILDRDMYSTSIDIWSFGCVLAEFAYGGPLFTGSTQTDLLSKIIRIKGFVTVDDIAHLTTPNISHLD